MLFFQSNDPNCSQFAEWAQEADYDKPTQPVAFGKCGDSVYWSLEFNEAKVFSLEVWGEGSIWDAQDCTSIFSRLSGMYYQDNDRCYPISISRIRIHEGIRTIGRAAFDSIPGYPTIELPDTLTEIGDWAFSETDPHLLLIPSSVRKCGESLINSNECSAGTIVISAAIEEVSPYAVGCRFGSIDRLYLTDTPAPDAFEKWIDFTVRKAVNQNGTQVYYPQSWDHLLNESPLREQYESASRECRLGLYPWTSYPDGTTPWIDQTEELCLSLMQHFSAIRKDYPYAYIPMDYVGGSIRVLGKEIKVYTGELLSEAWIQAYPSYQKVFRSDREFCERVDRANGKWLEPKGDQRHYCILLAAGTQAARETLMYVLAHELRHCYDFLKSLLAYQASGKEGIPPLSEKYSSWSEFNAVYTDTVLRLYRSSGNDKADFRRIAEYMGYKSADCVCGIQRSDDKKASDYFITRYVGAQRAVRDVAHNLCPTPTFELWHMTPLAIDKVAPDAFYRAGEYQEIDCYPFDDQ